MIRFNLASAATLTAGAVSVVTAGSGLTAGQNWVGLYTAAGTRVALSADQTANFGAVGEPTSTFTAPYAAAAGTYYLAILANGTTPPSLIRGVSSGTSAVRINRGLTPATARWTTGPTAQTTLPASITMASRSLGAAAIWGALL